MPRLHWCPERTAKAVAGLSMRSPVQERTRTLGGSHPSVRTVLPLSLVTCTSMLAMDLILPAVPALQLSLTIDVTRAQATVSVFLVGLAASQLLWGEALSRIGPRRAVQLGVWLLAIASVGCALARNIEELLAMRLLQGLAAGAAPVVASSVVRATLSNVDAVRGLAAIAMVESIVPALGPVLGAALLAYSGWRGLFWVLGAATLLVLPFVVRAAPVELPGMDRTVSAGYGRILRQRKYVRLALSHALAVGALLTFVASAPQLVVHAFHAGTSAFALLQVLGVAAFACLASQAGRIHRVIEPSRAVQIGALAQVMACGVLVLASSTGVLSFAGVVVFWCVFCGALAVRGPAAFSDALALPVAQIGRASAMLVLGILLAGALGTQVIAPFMGGQSGSPLALGMFGLCLVSLLLIVPYPSAPTPLPPAA
jgi:DHA1 family bicyclomycin/chloramphenicol resistance-like MFS transporter